MSKDHNDRLLSSSSPSLLQVLVPRGEPTLMQEEDDSPTNQEDDNLEFILRTAHQVLEIVDDLMTNDAGEREDDRAGTNGYDATSSKEGRNLQ